MPKSPVECDQLHAGLAVTDVPAAIDFYTKKLGFFLAFTDGDPVDFAGVNLGHVQIFLQKGEPDPKGCTVWFLVDSADELFALHDGQAERRLHPRAVDLACIGALAQMGFKLAWRSVLAPDEAMRARASTLLAWWVARVRPALAAWSPSAAG